MIFSVRLLNIVTFYNRNKNKSKNEKLCTKIRKFCMKTLSTKSNKEIPFKTNSHKVSFVFYTEEGLTFTY